MIKIILRIKFFFLILFILNYTNFGGKILNICRQILKFLKKFYNIYYLNKNYLLILYYCLITYFKIFLCFHLYKAFNINYINY
jgi:hypothetical protein